MKTAITILQEMMIKIGQTPEYECISQTGPQHQAMFEYKCVADGASATGVAHSKKEAKQEAARGVLALLAARGRPVPGGAPPAAAPARPAPAPLSHVALLRELCDEYRLPAVDYELVGDAGPPHRRHFTFRARIGDHVRQATASTKKMARQLAAEMLYVFLRENLRITGDFVEADALVRAHEKMMERYRETREETPWRPDFTQKISEYHLGLSRTAGAEKVSLARQALEETRAQEGEVRLGCAAAALDLQVEWAELAPLQLVALSPTMPPLQWAGRDRAAALAAALDHLELALALDPPPPC